VCGARHGCAPRTQRKPPPSSSAMRPAVARLGAGRQAAAPMHARRVRAECELGAMIERVLAWLALSRCVAHHSNG
jgi:hypothetical protein